MHHRAFITCASRARPTLSPLIDHVEEWLHDLGWHTRLPRRAPPRGGLTTDERRRLRLTAYRDLESCEALIHVPAGRSLEGVALHRELARGVALAMPICLLVAGDLRRELGIEAPSARRLNALVEATAGVVIHDLTALERILRRVA